MWLNCPSCQVQTYVPLSFYLFCSLRLLECGLTHCSVKSTMCQAMTRSADGKKKRWTLLKCSTKKSLAAGLGHHLRICVILRLTSLAPTPDKEISVGSDEQTKEDKCVTHFKSRSLTSLDAASFALDGEKKLTGQSSKACLVSDAS